MQHKLLIINLDSSTHRWNHVKKQLDRFNLSYERISAVDGSVDSEEFNRYSYSKNRVKYHTLLSKGEIACYLSHIKCWQKIVDEELDYAIILEDDINLLRDLNEINDLVSHPDFPEWDYIKLGERVIKRKNKIITQINDYQIFKYDKIPVGTHAQVVSYDGAKKLLKNSTKIYRPVDIDIRYFWENKLKIIGVKPYFLGVYGFKSDIDRVGDRKKKKNTIVRIINTVQNKIAKFIYEIKN